MKTPFACYGYAEAHRPAKVSCALSRSTCDGNDKESQTDRNEMTLFAEKETSSQQSAMRLMCIDL